MSTIGVLFNAMEDTAMSSLMTTLHTTLQQPLSMAVLAQCLDWATGRPPRKAAGTQQRRRRRPQPAVLQASAAPEACPDSDQPDERADGGQCGWFDSSHELHQGLVVLEHAGAESLGAEMPLDDWLGFVLDGGAQPSDLVLLPHTQGIITP